MPALTAQPANIPTRQPSHVYTVLQASTLRTVNLSVTCVWQTQTPLSAVARSPSVCVWLVGQG